MKKLFYNIMISIVIVHFCGVMDKINASEVQIERMNAEELDIKEKTVNELSNKVSKESKLKKFYEQQLKAIAKRRIELEKYSKKEKLPLVEAAKKFKEQAKAIKQETAEKKQASKTSERLLKDIQHIHKLVATSNQLFVMYKDNEKGPFKIAELDKNKDFSKIDIENPNVPQPSDPEEKITWLKEPAQSFCDITTYKNTYAYGYFFKQKTWGPFQSDMSMIDFLDEKGNKYPATNTHKTFIKSLFLDEQFIVSHSQAGNIRFIPINELKNEQKESLERFIEYKAEKLIMYNHKCLIYEKSTILSGTALYVAYIDENAEIVTEKKIGSYQKGDESPYLGAINENGDALIYDQYHRSLTVCKYTSNKKIIEQKFKNIDLPKQLKYRVAQQIYYIQNKPVLVFDNQIYTIDLENKTSPPNRIFPSQASKIEKATAVGKSLLQQSSDYVKTIVTTALQDNNMLWIISSKEFDAQEEQPTIKYSIQKVPLDAAKE